jgi:hypothetical protein
MEMGSGNEGNGESRVVGNDPNLEVSTGTSNSSLKSKV